MIATHSSLLTADQTVALSEEVTRTIPIPPYTAYVALSGLIENVAGRIVVVEGSVVVVLGSVMVVVGSMVVVVSAVVVVVTTDPEPEPLTVVVAET